MHQNIRRSDLRRPFINCLNYDHKRPFIGAPPVVFAFAPIVVSRIFSFFACAPFTVSRIFSVCASLPRPVSSPPRGLFLLVAALERTHQVDGVADALLPFAGDLKHRKRQSYIPAKI